MKRAVRRHHYKRLKLLRKKKWIFWNWHISDRISGIYANTACRCSCWMCGNPRRKFKAISRQEFIANIVFVEGCLEVGINCSLDYKNLGKISY